MKYSILFFVVTLQVFMMELTFGADYLTVQRSPIAITSTECTHGNPSPVLNKKFYSNSKKNYSRKIVNNKPLKTIEELVYYDGASIKIQQTGCEDMLGNIEIKLPSSCKEILSCSIKLLKDLKFESDAFFLHDKHMKEITNILEGEVDHDSFRKTNRTIVCLSRIEPGNKNSECVTDLKIVKSNHALDLTYIDRP